MQFFEIVSNLGVRATTKVEEKVDGAALRCLADTATESAFEFHSSSTPYPLNRGDARLRR